MDYQIEMEMRLKSENEQAKEFDCPRCGVPAGLACYGEGRYGVKVRSHKDRLKQFCPVEGCGFSPGIYFSGQLPCQRAWSGDVHAHRDYLRGCRLSK